MGPEPFSDAFSVAYLRRALKGRTAPLKSFLLDQRRIAGVGNIYADEALFRARLHPLRAAGSVGPREAQRLHAALLETLQAGIDHEGSSIESFVDPGRRARQLPGDPERLPAHRRAVPRCAARRCSRTVVGGRGTHFCPHCQPRRGGIAPTARRRPSSAVPGARQAARLRGAAPAARRRTPSKGSPTPAVNPLYIVLTWVPRGRVVSIGSSRRRQASSAAGMSTWAAPKRAREARVARHLALAKPLRWHADYLFAAAPGALGWLVDTALTECELADGLARLPGAERRPPRFGRGDCSVRRPPRATRPAPPPRRPSSGGGRWGGGHVFRAPPLGLNRASSCSLRLTVRSGVRRVSPNHSSSKSLSCRYPPRCLYGLQ